MIIKGHELRPGDCLLYKRTPFKISVVGWFFGLVINIKTWSRFSHVEVYDGDGLSMASRDGKGVAKYAFRKDQLVCIRRPGPSYSHEAARHWFRTVDGQQYDWVGLLSFAYAVRWGSSAKKFCSEFATHLYRNAGVEVFNKDMEAETVAPAQLWQTPRLTTVIEFG